MRDITNLQTKTFNLQFIQFDLDSIGDGGNMYKLQFVNYILLIVYKVIKLKNVYLMKNHKNSQMHTIILTNSLFLEFFND